MRFGRFALSFLCTALLVSTGCGTSSTSDGGSGGATASSTGAGTGDTSASSSDATTGPSSSSATASSSNASTGSGAPAVAECNDPADCKAVSDCCSCIGLPGTEKPPKCDLPNCFADTCTALGFGPVDPSCTAGRCTLFSCDPALVTCKKAPPVCPAGQVPAVSNDCWASCVPANDCAYVPDCTKCASKGEVCVTESTKGGQVHHCVVVPPACEGKPTCACMGDSVCLGAFDVCNDGSEGITCGCTVC